MVSFFVDIFRYYLICAQSCSKNDGIKWGRRDKGDGPSPDSRPPNHPLLLTQSCFLNHALLEYLLSKSNPNGDSVRSPLQLLCQRRRCVRRAAGPIYFMGLRRIAGGMYMFTDVSTYML